VSGRRAFGWALGVATASICVFAAAVSASGGLSWSGPVPISPYATLTVGCASKSFCVAAGYTGRAELWNGSSWSAPDDIDGTNNIDGVSCSSSSFCVAVGSNGDAATWNGHAWSMADIDTTNQLSAVSCASSSFCVAVDLQGYAVAWNGHAWGAPAHIDTSGALGSVSCVSTGFCTAVDAGRALTWNGSTWSAPVAIDPGNLGWVSCASPSFCVAVEDFGNGTTIWNGHSWSATVDIDPPSGTFTNRLSGVSCASASFCVAVADAGEAIAWNGTSWSAPVDLVASGSTLDSFNDPVSCVSSSFCAVVGAYPYSFALTYGDNLPVLGKSVVASVVSGSVSVEPPGGTAFAPLSASTPIPVGSTVDAIHGTVRLTAAGAGHRSHAGQFYDGEFKLGQSHSGLSKLTLTGGAACAASARASAHKPRRAVQSLWGDAHGSFETVTADASAVDLGTRWEMVETCTGTTIHAAEGVVEVTDFARHRTLLLHAPHSYHAG
jgi:hypothetical protein